MNPILFALRHPYTVLVGILGLAVGSVLAVNRMPIDIFPALNLPVIYVCQPYGGLSPGQMEGQITNYYEYHFLYINGIHHVESKNIQSVAVMKLFFHPGTDMAQAMAETVSYVNRSRAFMPPNTVGPFIMRFDTGSVPVGYLVLEPRESVDPASGESKTRPIGEIQRMALFDVRPIFASLPGVSAPPPFGGNQRTIVVDVDPKKADAKKIAMGDVIAAVQTGNLVSPAGNLRIQDKMLIVNVNAMAVNPQEIGNIPVKPGSPICLRDVAEIKDATDVPTGFALVNGRRAVYVLVTKRADASTMTVVNAVKANLPRMQAVLPDDVQVRFEFDQSPYVTRSMWGVGSEAALGACLTGLMVLLFLRDWRSVLVVVLNIPLALLGAVLALWLSGQSLNLMTLGGLALAVGILVDEATVEVENIHVQLRRTRSIARAVRLGNAETAVPRLLAMLCVLAVFVSSFFMEGAIRALFVPLSLAVGFAMITSYLLSSTFVPVLSVWLLRHNQPGARATGLDSSGPVARAPGYLMRLRWLFVPAYLAAAAVVVWFGGKQLGTEIFPSVDAGQFQLRLRTSTGTRIERTEELTQATLEVIHDVAGENNVALSIAYVGVVPTSYPINSVYLWMGGPEEAVLRVALQRGAVSMEAFKERLRKELPERLPAKLQARRWPQGQIDAHVRDLQVSFEPADIVNEVMSFGTRTPVEIQVTGPRLPENRAIAEKIYARLKDVPTLRDPSLVQTMDYPTLDVQVDQEKLVRSGGTMQQLSASVLAFTSSSRFVVPNYWADPNTGVGFQVQVQVPLALIESYADLEQVVVYYDPEGNAVRLRDVALVRRTQTPGEYDRYNMRRVASITANVAGEDLGRVAKRLDTVIADLGPLPKGVQVDVRGQIEPMRQMFRNLALGLGMAVGAILLLLTAYFQSLRLALVVLGTLPAVLAGVVLALLATGTTLSIQSFMGAIMAIGVGVANAILLVTFAENARRTGLSAVNAAIDGARHRVRPILMTSFAMIAGMFPLALGLGEGGEQTAPLGRAVIGGLLAATVTTLFVLPSFFALVMGRSSTRSASLDPDDPDSVHHDTTAWQGNDTPPGDPTHGTDKTSPAPA